MTDLDSPVKPSPAASGSPDGQGEAEVRPTGADGVPVRQGLDRARIINAAVELIDSQGLRAFTMRSLGARLGVEAMALYRYVYGREALLDSIVEHVIDDLYGDPDVHLRNSNWQDYMVRLAHGVRRIALAHPEVFPLIATRPPAAPWVRPPLRSLRWMESFLENLTQCGFDDEAAVRAYQGFSSFLLGHLLLEVSARGADIGPIPQAPPDHGSEHALDGYPLLKRLEPLLSQDRSSEDFEASLETLLERLDADR